MFPSRPIEISGETNATREEQVMHRENMKSFAIAMTAALGFLLATVPVASAQNVFQCTGTIKDGRTINSNLVVPAGATCILTNVTVVGNVQVGTGAILGVGPSTPQAVSIDGNIVADGCDGVVLDASTGVISVEGNVNIQNCTAGVIGYQAVKPNLTISGNFTCANNSPSVCQANAGVVRGNLIVDNNTITHSNVAEFNSVIGNQISGNVEFSGNTETFPPVINGNTIGGNLLCSGNGPAPLGSNAVGGNKLGQCVSL
jgi:hypothetical protein